MTEHDWTVSVPSPGDAAGIEAPITGCGLFPPEEAEGFAAMVPDLLSDPAQHWLVLRKGRAVLGAAYYSLERMSEDVWNLWFIGLTAETQGQGGGTRLIHAVEEACRNAGGRLLLVETSGTTTFEATRGFYAARGYAEEARIRDYYAPGDAKVIYRLML